MYHVDVYHVVVYHGVLYHVVVYHVVVYHVDVLRVCDASGIRLPCLCPLNVIICAVIVATVPDYQPYYHSYRITNAVYFDLTHN